MKLTEIKTEYTKHSLLDKLFYLQKSIHEVLVGEEITDKYGNDYKIENVYFYNWAVLDKRINDSSVDEFNNGKYIKLEINIDFDIKFDDFNSDRRDSISRELKRIIIMKSDFPMAVKRYIKKNLVFLVYQDAYDNNKYIPRMIININKNILDQL